MQTQTYVKTFRTVMALFALVIAFSGCGGGGGGGGGSNGGPATVTGIVLSASTDQPPSSAGTVTIGSSSVQTNADGSFSLNAPVSATSATISAPGEVTRTITIKLVSGSNNLGNIFLADTGSAYNATVQGTVVSTVNGTQTPVAGATVTIANVTTTTASNGAFTLNNLPVGLGTVDGLYGMVTATGYANKLITADTLGFALVSGVNNIGNLLLAKPSGSTPPPPFNITGVVKVTGTATSGLTVYLLVANTQSTVAQTTTDASGAYYFWVAPGQYTVEAVDAASTLQQENVTLTSVNVPVVAPTMNLSP